MYIPIHLAYTSFNILLCCILKLRERFHLVLHPLQDSHGNCPHEQQEYILQKQRVLPSYGHPAKENHSAIARDCKEVTQIFLTATHLFLYATRTYLFLSLPLPLTECDGIKGLNK